MSGEDLYIFVLQAGIQYLIPAAILLRALYFGARGKLPEGLRDILIAAVVAGMGALIDGEASSIGDALVEVVFNALFMYALLFFILIYLLKLPNLGPWVDGVIGGGLGFIAWLAWVYVLGNDWPTWSAPLTAMGGAAAFIGLRSLIRRIAALGRFAGRAARVGIAVAVVGGLIWLAVTVL